MWTRTLLTASFCRFSARVSPACLIEKNIGPSSASHSEEEAGRGVEAAREDGGEEEARGGGKKRRQEEEARGGSKRRKQEEEGRGGVGVFTRVDGGDTLHVLFARHDELVVHHITVKRSGGSGGSGGQRARGVQLVVHHITVKRR